MEQYIKKSDLVAEIERLKNTSLEYGYNTMQKVLADSGKDISLVQLQNFIDDLEVKEVQEEPVSEDLEEAAHKYADGENPTCPCEECLIKTFKDGAEWQKEKEYTCYEEAFEDGAKWKVENLWKPADGDDLPEIDREVVVFTQNFPDDVGMMSVAIAHRPNPDGWDGKSLSTGKVEHYTPKTYDKGGWNIPDVKYWLDVELPKEIEL